MGKCPASRKTVSFLQVGKKHLGSYLLVLPAFFYVLAVLAFPLFYNFILSLGRIINFKQPIQFVGFLNYINLLSSESFRATVVQTVWWAIFSVIFQVLIGSFAALLASQSKMGKSIGLSVLLIPWMTSFIVAALVWRSLFVYNGVINDLLIRIGFLQDGLQWFSKPATARITVVIANVWKYFPFMMLLVLGGLQSIPVSVTESAIIEGANAWRRMISITLPIMRPVILVMVMIGFIHAFNSYTLIYIMTGGGPLGSTRVLAILIHELAFKSLSFELAAAASTILFIIISILIGLYLHIFWKESDL